MKRNTERNGDAKHRPKSKSKNKHKSNFSDIGNPYEVIDKGKTPSEYKKLEPMELGSPSERRDSFNHNVARPSNLDDDFI